MCAEWEQEEAQSAHLKRIKERIEKDEQAEQQRGVIGEKHMSYASTVLGQSVLVGRIQARVTGMLGIVTALCRGCVR